MKRYHKSIGFPKTIFLFPTRLTLIYTKHAKLRKREYNAKKVPKILKFRPSSVIELQSKNKKKVFKMVVRVHYNKKQDIVLVLKPDFRKDEALLITFWLNDKSDKHTTLNKSKYNRP